MTINKLKKISVDQFLDDVKDRYDLTSNSKVAEHFGLSRASIAQWKQLNHVPMKYLLSFYKQNESEFQYPDDAVIMKKEKGLIPVVGLAQAGPGIISEDDYPAGSGDEYLSRPHGLRDSQAFGVVVVDDSMKPAFRHHQRIICSPNIEAQTGDRCVVGLRSGERLIAEVRFNGEEIHLKKYHGTDIHVKKEDVEFVYKIVWSKEL
jgi:phage repressor protein C with HTH and peptisase S24 domain